MRAYVLFGAAVALACGASAQAASLTDYNVIVTGDVTLNSAKIYGTLAVGGNIAANNSPVFHKSVVVGGQVTGAYNLISGTVTQGNFDVTDYDTAMKSMSLALSQLTVDSLAPTTNSIAFNATPGVDNVAVFEVEGSIFSNQDYQNGWSFNVPNGVTVVINVKGTDIDFTKGNFNTVTNRDHIIWNFYQATSVDLSSMGGEFQGTILAPFATLDTSSHHTNGDVYVKNLIANGGSQLHLVPFDGDLPVGSPPPIPEPATVGLLLPFAAGMLLRRGKRQ